MLGSGIAFLDGTVVNVALPAIGRDLDAGITGLQWTLDSYLVTLTAFLVLGGALGDRYGRRLVFVTGLAGFALSSLLCAVAPSIELLVAARALQGLTGALLVPGSLAIISTTFHRDDRSRAIGAWSGLAGISSAIGPFIGGWLVDAVSWRWIFVINLPLAAVAWVAARHIPETRDPQATGLPDFAGAACASLGLAGVCLALIEGANGFGPLEVVAAIAGGALLVAFIVVERRTRQPMLPLVLFESAQFTGANLTTFAVYAGLGGATFFLVLELQLVLGYSALEAGMALLPVTILMLVLSPRMGALAARIGPRLPMTVGPLVVAAGLLTFALVDDGSSYLSTVLPAAVVFGLGLSITVAPLTAAVLASVEERHMGAGSAVNNAVARLAGLLAVAVLPAVAGIGDTGSVAEFSDGYATAMLVAAAVSAVGGVVAWFTVRDAVEVDVVPNASIHHPCGDPCLGSEEHEAA